MRVGQELLDRVAIPGKPVWNEAVVAWTKHRDVQKPVDQQLARVRVKVTLNRMAIDWNTDKKTFHSVASCRSVSVQSSSGHRKAPGLGTGFRIGAALRDTDKVESGQSADESPWALQLVARVEKFDPPGAEAIAAAAALATIELLNDPRSQPEGQWHDAVTKWNGARIRKIVRRGRASAWQRAQELEGVTVERDGAEVRAFLPSPMDQAPDALTKLQIRSSPLDEIKRVGAVPNGGGLFLAVTPRVEMSWGKQAAQCAHAGQWAWMRSDSESVRAWNAAGKPITILHPTEALWVKLVVDAPVQIHDGGFTEIPAGTKTAVAWWTKPFNH